MRHVAQKDYKMTRLQAIKLTLMIVTANAIITTILMILIR